MKSIFYHLLQNYILFKLLILPVNIAPFGILAPRSIYCCGFFKKFTNSIISILASSHPATSLMCNINEIYINEQEILNYLYDDKIYLLLT